MLKQIVVAAIFGMTSLLTFAGNEYVPGKNYQEVTPGWCPTNGGTCNKHIRLYRCVNFWYRSTCENYHLLGW